VLLAAGALQYSKKKFVAALAAGRAVRYMLVAGVGSIYAKQITGFFSRYYKPAVLTLVGFAVLGSVLTLIEYLRHRKHSDGGTTVQRKVA
jgi:membrane protein YqaA with SNARE-associated domain